jgi:hypothetical protein
MPGRTHRAATEDLVDVLLERVRQIRDDAERKLSASAHAVGLAREIFDHRAEYAEALTTLRRVIAEDRHDLFLMTLAESYKNAQARLGLVEHRSDLLLEIVDVWLQSLRHVEDYLAGRPLPYHWYLDDDDRAMIAEDLAAESDFGALGIVEAWQA